MTFLKDAKKVFTISTPGGVDVSRIIKEANDWAVAIPSPNREYNNKPRGFNRLSQKSRRKRAKH